MPRQPLVPRGARVGVWGLRAAPSGWPRLATAVVSSGTSALPSIAQHGGSCPYCCWLLEPSSSASSAAAASSAAPSAAAFAAAAGAAACRSFMACACARARACAHIRTRCLGGWTRPCRPLTGVGTRCSPVPPYPTRGHMSRRRPPVPPPLSVAAAAAAAAAARGNNTTLRRRMRSVCHQSGGCGRIPQISSPTAACASCPSPFPPAISCACSRRHGAAVRTVQKRARLAHDGAAVLLDVHEAAVAPRVLQELALSGLQGRREHRGRDHTSYVSVRGAAGATLTCPKAPKTLNIHPMPALQVRGAVS